MKTRVFILYTGGTIGMAPKDPSDPFSPLAPQKLDDLLGFVPGFDKSAIADETRFRSLEAKAAAQANAKKKAVDRVPFMEMPNGNVIEFGSVTIEPPIDSSDITPTDWKRMAKEIKANYDAYDGFVVLHGTDTMAFTSSALSFIFENLSKPVVITGSQLPISNDRTDAVLNFVNAIHIAGYQATDQPLIPEVIIVFADRVLRGCRASKVSSTNWAGFDSPNFPWLGTIGEHIVINTNYVLPAPSGNKKFFVKPDLEEKVFNVSIFPGFADPQMGKIFLDEGTQGIVMRSYGAGNVPGKGGFLESIEQAVHAGRLIVNISQCTEGTVEMGLYEASSGLLERGVLSGMDMTPEAAMTKLMWTLANQFGEGRTTQMQIAQRGEQTENLFDLRFGDHAEMKKNAPAAGVYINSVQPDGRLDRSRISRAMLRLSGLACPGAADGDRIRVHAFMNMPRADHSTTTDEDRRVASFEFGYDADEPVKTRMQNITYKAQSVIGEGDVILTLVAQRAPHGSEDFVPTEIEFRGLFAAVYAKA